jgi:hypothetical protein
LKTTHTSDPNRPLRITLAGFTPRPSAGGYYRQGAKTMTTTKTLTAKEVEARSEHRLYSDCGHNYLADHAESQLSGRSHYYDADTRRYFGARVNHLTVERNGLLLCTVESVSPPSGSRAHRAVVFDLSGTLIYRS